MPRTCTSANANARNCILPKHSSLQRGLEPTSPHARHTHLTAALGVHSARARKLVDVDVYKDYTWGEGESSKEEEVNLIFNTEMTTLNDIEDGVVRIIWLDSTSQK